ncbi:hypothetical protein IKF25_00660 [Candidatus Saccharibacteria bacterium]|nr:hypothetical protein [Candidatus Saccharibacteria bacterium]
MKSGSGAGSIIGGMAVFVLLCGAIGSLSSNSGHSSSSNLSSNSSYATKSSRVTTKNTYACSDGAKYESYSDYLECENKYNWKIARDKALAECQADSSKINCWYDEYPGTTLHWEYYVYEAPKRQAPTSSGTRYGAICRDGTRSNATGRGACSHHGGVSTWLTY